MIQSIRIREPSCAKGDRMEVSRLFLATFCIPTKTGPTRYALVYCGWLLFEFIFIFRYVIETKGRSLEQTAALFDGLDHADALKQGIVLPLISFSQ